MPAPSYIGTGVVSTDLTIGASAAETGILMSNISYDLDNPSVDFFDEFGSEIGSAVGHNAAMNYTLDGEVSDKDAGVNVTTFIAAATIANEEFFASASSTHHGIDFSSATTRLVSASGAQPRGDARTVSLGYRRPLNFAIA